MEPVVFEIRLADFDLDLLPVNKELLKKQAERLEQAVTEWFKGQLNELGGVGEVSVSAGTASVVWVPSSLEDGDRFAAHLADLLQRGAHDVAGPMLESLVKGFPGSQGVHFNLGMMLSNQGKLDEAVTHFRQAVNLGDRPVDAWNALGVALARQGNGVGALDAFAHACELAPENGHVLRNYGGFLARKEPEKGLPYLRKAAALLPDDQQTQYGYALALLEAANPSDADPVLRRVIDLSPHSQVAGLARELLTRIAAHNVREAAGGAPRMDVVHYMMDAMEKLKEIGLEAFKPITIEIAMLGIRGLDIDDAEKRYSLTTLTGEFSGLQLVSYMYVGFERLSPGVDQGMDLTREYILAEELTSRGDDKDPADVS